MAATTHPTEPQTRLRGRAAFVVVGYGLWIVMLGGTIPTPLYPIYESRFHFSPTIVTVIFAVYAIGVLTGLLLLARASDSLGRRPVLLLGAGVGVLSAIVFVVASGVPDLLLARILSGLSVGLVTSTATATLTELEPEGHRERASRTSATLNLIGLASGPLLAGAFAQYATLPTTLVFVVDIVLLLPVMVGILLVPETAPMKGPRWTIARLFVPSEVRSIFAVAAVTAFASFAEVGLFSALAGSLLTSILDISNLAVVGGTVFLLFASATLAQLVWNSSRWDPVSYGLGALIVGVALNLLALLTHSETAFWAGVAISGAGFGLSFLGSLAHLNERAPPARRGEVLGAYFVAAYVGISVPVIGVGLLVGSLGLALAAEVFSAVVVVVLGVAWLSFWHLRRKPTVASPA